MSASNYPGAPIEHIVVLMLENRSYDQMLGFLPRHGHLADSEGLTGDEFNRVNPFHPDAERYYVQEGALFEFTGSTTR